LLHDRRILFAPELLNLLGIDRQADASQGGERDRLPGIRERDIGQSLSGPNGLTRLDITADEAAGHEGDELALIEGAELFANLDAGAFGEAPLQGAGLCGEDGGRAQGGEQDRTRGGGIFFFEREGGAESHPGRGIFQLLKRRRKAGDFGADAGVAIAAQACQGGMGTGKLAQRGLNPMRWLRRVEVAVDLPIGQRNSGNPGVPIEPAGRRDEQEQENSKRQACSVARGFDTLRGSMKSLFPLFLAMVPLAAQTPVPVEKLSYNVEWRMVNAGAAVLTNNPTPSGSFVQLHLHSAGLVSRLFKVNDNYTVALNDQFCAQSSRLEAEEGKKRRNTTVVWSGTRSKYEERDLVKNEMALERELEVPGCVHDIIGALMVLRQRPFGSEREIRIPLSDGKKFVQARIQMQDKEKIRTPAGQFTATRYEAFLFNDVIYKRDARLFVWLSDDARRLPVQIQVRMKFHIGTVTFQLDKVEP